MAIVGAPSVGWHRNAQQHSVVLALGTFQVEHVLAAMPRHYHLAHCCSYNTMESHRQI